MPNKKTGHKQQRTTTEESPSQILSKTFASVPTMQHISLGELAFKTLQHPAVPDYVALFAYDLFLVRDYSIRPQKKLHRSLQAVPSLSQFLDTPSLNEAVAPIAALEVFVGSALATLCHARVAVASGTSPCLRLRPHETTGNYQNCLLCRL